MKNNDNDNDNLFSQISAHKSLTCPERQSAWALAPSYKVAFQRVPLRTILYRGEQCRVVREIVVVSVGSGWLWAVPIYILE